jgi:hypothetical protein
LAVAGNISISTARLRGNFFISNRQIYSKIHCKWIYGTKFR